jgi:catalase
LSEQTDRTKKPGIYHAPNSFNSPKENRRYVEPALPLHSSANRYDHRECDEDYRRAGKLFRLFGSEDRQWLFQNIAAAMRSVPEEIKRRQIALFAKCDPAFGAGVAKAVELDTGQ